MPQISPARVLERLLGSPEAKQVATAIAAEDFAQRQALVQRIAEHQRDYTADGPRLLADVERAKDEVPAARKVLRDALQKHAAAQRVREVTLNGHLSAVTEAQAELTRLSPPFLKVAIHNATLKLRETEGHDDGSTERAVRREGLKWSLLALTALQLTAEPIPSDVDAIETQAMAVGALWFGTWRVRKLCADVARYPLEEHRGLKVYASACRTTLRELNAMDPHSPSLERDLDKLRANLARLTPQLFRGDAW